MYKYYWICGAIKKDFTEAIEHILGLNIWEDRKKIKRFYQAKEISLAKSWRWECRRQDTNKGKGNTGYNRALCHKDLGKQVGPLSKQEPKLQWISL